MKSRNSKFALMAGLVGLASFVVTACTDSDTAQETQKKVEDGISFAVTDIQNISESSLPKTKAPSVYETTSTPLEGEGAEGLSLLETTVEGVNPVYQPAATRGTITTNDNFAGLDKPFAIFATKEGSTAANYLYNEKVNADGTMVNPVKWKKSESSKLKFFAVHPATNGVNSMVTTTSGTNPVVNYTPDTDVKKQFDLLVANTNPFNYDDYVNQKIPIAFSHATTAVLFKVGNDLSYNQQVKKIEIRNVIGNGTYDIATKAWTVGTTKKTFELDLSAAPFSTATNVGAIMNGGDGTFFMVPQDIPADADVKITFVSGKSVVAKIGGNGKKWVAGTTRTYAISNPKDLEDRNAVLTVSSDKSTYNYNETNVPFKVTSYSQLTGSGRPSKAEPWAITKYEFSADGTTWTEGKPSMVASVSSESGNGGTSAEPRTMTFTNDYHDYKAEREAALKAATEENGKDLSMVNGSKSTANCYIVSAGGTYKFPMVYGNAYKNGVDNTEAYKPTGASSNYFVTPFYHGTDEVQYSWGKDNGEITKAEIEHADDAKVLWNSEPNLVKDAKISADGKFVEFSVDRSKIKEASAIIAVTRGTTYKNVLWSWHIWITSKDVVDTDNGYFMREPLGFRHTKWQGTTYEKDRKVRLTVTQTRTGKTATVEFTQKASPMVREGEAMYYQQGRKDPLINATGFSHQPPVNNSGLVLLHSVNFPMRMGAARRYNETGVSKGNWDWCWNPDENGTYFNLWDANNRQGHGYTGAFVKTVYDPSPVGFRVPRLAEFEKINNGNNGKAAFTPLTGVLSYVDFTIMNKGTNGYYWSSEKKEGPGNMGKDQEFYGYYGLFALARGSQKDLVLKRDFTTTKNFPMFQNMAWGANVISIKE
jgi:hypothetical protein